MHLEIVPLVDSLLPYAVVAGIAWLLAYVFFKKRWRLRKIIRGYPLPSDVRREMGWSLLAASIFGLVAAGTLLLGKLGWTQIYFRIDEHGWIWFWCSVVIAIIAHDAYFYWTHRLMHHRALFRWFHQVHHERRAHHGPRRPDETWRLQSLGVTFGDALAQKMELAWVTVEDEYGRDPALQDRGTTLLVFPLTTISKRVERGDAVDVRELFDQARQTITRLRGELKGA